MFAFEANLLKMLIIYWVICMLSKFVYFRIFDNFIN